MKFAFLICFLVSAVYSLWLPTPYVAPPFEPIHRPPLYPLKCGNQICESWLFESCLSCPGDCGICPSCDGICGDDRCELPETPCNCPHDCGPCCVDDICEPGETALNCPQDCTTDLIGLVDDHFTVLPLPLASVTCQSEPTLLGQVVVGPVLTDSNGNFRFSSLPGGYYTCTAVLANYQTGSTNFFFQAGLLPTPQPEIRISLIGEYGSISGEFRSTQTQGYIRDVNVTCRTNHISTRTGALINKPYYKFSSDSYFLFTLTGGNYLCEAQKAGYISVFQPAVVTVGQNTLVQFWLTPYNVTLEGKITLQIPQPLSYAPLNGTVACTDALGVTVTTSIINSYYSMILAPWTTYCCFASSPNALTRQFTINEAFPNSTIIFNYWLALATELIDNIGNNLVWIRNVIDLSIRYGDMAPTVTPLEVTWAFGLKAAQVYTPSIVASITSVLPVDVQANSLYQIIFNYFVSIGETLNFSQLDFYNPILVDLDLTAGTAYVTGYLKGIQQLENEVLGDTTFYGAWRSFVGSATFSLVRQVSAPGEPTVYQINGFNYTRKAAFYLPSPTK